MRRFLLSAAAVVVGLALVGAVEAAPKGGGSRGGSHNSYHMTHGTKFKGGYFYKGRAHSHWTHRYWYGKYGCYTYYCPSTCCWYYWYQPTGCYYPCSYIAKATPVYEKAPVDVVSGVTQITNVNVKNNSPEIIPGGPAPVGPGPSVPMPPAPPGQ
jgi:hypothetical protein